MKWFKNNEQDAAQKQLQNIEAQNEQARHWEHQGQALQGAIRARLEIIVRDRHPDLPDDSIILLSYYTYCLMHGDEKSRLPNDGASPEQVQRASVLALEMMARTELRALAVDPAHAAALYWLTTGIDFITMAPDQWRLGLAERYAEFAIEWAESRAVYLATAVQINMTWGRFSRALNLATIAVELDPENAEAARMKGMALFANGDLSGAKETLELARRMLPGLDGVDEAIKAIKVQLRR